MPSNMEIATYDMPGSFSSTGANLFPDSGMETDIPALQASANGQSQATGSDGDPAAKKHAACDECRTYNLCCLRRRTLTVSRKTQAEMLRRTERLYTMREVQHCLCLFPAEANG